MASTITIGNVTELADPKVRAIATLVVREIELAVEKVVAHTTDPGGFPLPRDPGAAESILQARYADFKLEQKLIAQAKLMPRINATAAARTKALGDLAGVDLRSATPVAEQKAAGILPPALKLQMATLTALTEVHGQIVHPSGLIPQQTTDRLEFRVHRVKAVDETGGFLAEKLGTDEIDLGATTADETGDIRKVSPFRVGKFNDGDQKVFSPPRRFTTFNLNAGTDFPKSYFVTLVLAEKDPGGGQSDFVNSLMGLIQRRVTERLTAAGVAVGSSGGPVGAIIGASVGFVVGKVFEFIKSVFADEVFQPRTVNVAIPSFTHRFKGGGTDSPEEVVRFTGHGGTYDLTYDWRLLA